MLLASVRQDGLTLPKIARNMIGPVAGATTAIATLFIVIAVLASVAIVVVKALSHSSVGHVHDPRDDPRRAADRAPGCTRSGPARWARPRSSA